MTSLCNNIMSLPMAAEGGQLVFLSGLPREVLVLAFLIGAAIMWLLYRRVASRVSRRTRVVLLGLRIAFLAVLLAILAIPAIQTPRTRPSDIFTAVLVDTSRSMSISDVPGDSGNRPRIDAARQLLQGKDGLLGKLSQSSRVLVYGFDRTARRLEGGTPIKADGSSTDIFGSMKEAESQLRGMPLSAVVMITDGARNAGGPGEEAAKLLASRGVPLHIVGVGDPRPPRDYEVVKVFAPRRVRRNSEVQVTATVRNTDYHDPFQVQIVRGDAVLVSKTVQPAENGDLQQVHLSFTPDQEGSATYKVAIPVATGEQVTSNNLKEFTLEIQDDRLPVLYIEGSPRTEYRFLRRVLFRDRDFRLVGLLRLAKDRFYVQGANQSEQYLQKGFPDTPERMFAFQAIILGDIEASYFTPRQLELLEEFVRVRGGGLIMLGGVNSFGLGKYAGTPVGKLLPVDVSPADPPYSDQKYNARVTADGLKHPVMRLLDDPQANARMWENAPQLIGVTPVRGVKPGAQLLLTDDKGSLPVLAVQNYGLGRAAAFTSGGSWYWQMSVPISEQFHEKFWKQLIRWLVVGAREQFTVETDADVYARRDPVVIKAGVSGKDLRPINDATVIATVTDPLGNAQELHMDWILSQEGAYQCRYVPEDEGNYVVSVRVEGWDSKPLQTEFRVSEPLVEFNDSGLKESSLRAMAQLTGGRYWRPDEASVLADEVAGNIRQAATAGIMPRQTPIWDTPVLFAVLLVLACVEWIIRRRAGLA